MVKISRAGLLGALLLALTAVPQVAMSTPQNGQPEAVPLPRPAPHARERQKPAETSATGTISGTIQNWFNKIIPGQNQDKPTQDKSTQDKPAPSKEATPSAAVTPPAAKPDSASPKPEPLQLAAPPPSARPLPTPAVPTTRPQLAATGQPPAFDANQKALIERVNTYLTSVNSLVGDFVQVGPDGKRTDGKFYLHKPGRVRFEYNPPTPIELVADGTSVVVRDRKLATQDLYPLGQTPLRFLLSDRVNLTNDSNLVAVHADELFVSIVVQEKHVIGGTHRLMLMFGAQDMQLRQWTVTDPQGYDTTVAVYNLDTKQKPDPANFRINYDRVLQ